ncbi:MAG TPA: cysteine peptidase family C39 domain-containing protein [Terriglobales bacterium]|nr:cysteine peptidase family C39 domain-containing protein [Terriglobales bacterium]
MSAAAAVPYEKQSDLQTNRGCGAACLSMVYRSFGKEIPQTEIWPAIAKENRFGSMASTTHLMAKDALGRDFTALAMQARHPLLSLRLCRDLGFRAILNHRIRSDSAAGHYTVLVDIDDRNVTLHDPLYGPARQLSHGELLELWQPFYPNSEIVGYMMIVIAPKSAGEARVCDLCRTSIPGSIRCPQCKEAVELQPSVVLGCVSSACIARGWNYVCCPFCDHTWSFGAQAEGLAPADSATALGRQIMSRMPTAGAAAASASADDPWNLQHLFGVMDKFCNFVMSVPGAAGNPEIKRQLDYMVLSKERLKLAQAEELVRRKVLREQMAKAQDEAKQREEAYRKKVETLNTPSPPLDGNALGRALLKNLGFPTK